MTTQWKMVKTGMFLHELFFTIEIIPLYLFQV